MAISKRLRFEILRRDGNTCRYCGSGGTVANPLVVDHVMPSVLGGSDHPSNLVASCVACNAGKTSSLPSDVTVEDIATHSRDWALRMCGVAWKRINDLQAEVAAIRLAGQIEAAERVLGEFDEEEQEDLIRGAQIDLDHENVEPSGIAGASARDEQMMVAAGLAVSRLYNDRWRLDVEGTLLLQSVPTEIRERVKANTHRSLARHGCSPEMMTSAELLGMYLRSLANLNYLDKFSQLDHDEQEEWLAGARHMEPESCSEEEVRITAATNAEKFKQAGRAPYFSCSGVGRHNAACNLRPTVEVKFDGLGTHKLCDPHLEAARQGEVVLPTGNGPLLDLRPYDASKASF